MGWGKRRGEGEGGGGRGWGASNTPQQCEDRTPFSLAYGL